MPPLPPPLFFRGESFDQVGKIEVNCRLLYISAHVCGRHIWEAVYMIFYTILYKQLQYCTSSHDLVKVRSSKI
jgi:hypothetical protein